MGGGEQGRAIVEFVFLGVMLFVPLVYLVIALAAVQGAAFSATTAAREAGRAFTTADREDESLARARAAAALAFEDFGFGQAQAGIEAACDGSPCLRPDARVSITATIHVRLPLIPALGGDDVAAIPVSVTHIASVDRFGGRS
ncbi:MAG: pilus assembly protein [Actinomycetales bacterium]|nr:pilus assembly protein [Actinomycetales bacterium]